MKRKWLTFLLGATLLFLSLAATTHAINVNLNVLDPFIVTGESFNVGVSVGAADASFGDLTAFGFDVTVGSLFTYDGYTLGAGYDDGFSNVSGTSLNIEGLFNDFSSLNAGSDILLATLSFTAEDIAGTDLFCVQGLFNLFAIPTSGLFYEFADVGIELSAAEITINAAPVPEPATLLLLGTGLVGVLGFQKRRGGKA